MIRTTYLFIEYYDIYDNKWKLCKLPNSLNYMIDDGNIFYDYKNINRDKFYENELPTDSNIYNELTKDFLNENKSYGYFYIKDILDNDIEKHYIGNNEYYSLNKKLMALLNHINGDNTLAKEILNSDENAEEHNELNNYVKQYIYGAIHIVEFMLNKFINENHIRIIYFMI